MTNKTPSLQKHSGMTGPLDPVMERAHLLAKWEERELTSTVPLADTEDWLLAEEAPPRRH